MQIKFLWAAALDLELRARGIVYKRSPSCPISRADCAEIMEAVLDRTVAAGSTVTKQREENAERSERNR